MTAESVRAGHPDKFCDQIADAILDAHLAQDPNARVAVEVFATEGKIVIGGEVTFKADVNCARIVYEVIRRIGYGMKDLSDAPEGVFELEVCFHEQSPDIMDAVNKEMQGAGDQGIMVGYATDETHECMPLPVLLAHSICRKLDELQLRCPWMGADAKAQVTVAYEDDKPVAITALVISVQHDESIGRKGLMRFLGKELMGTVLPKELMKHDTRILINPSGSFVKGGLRRTPASRVASWQ